MKKAKEMMKAHKTTTKTSNHTSTSIATPEDIATLNSYAPGFRLFGRRVPISWIGAT